jgi:hypothetical protein
MYTAEAKIKGSGDMDQRGAKLLQNKHSMKHWLMQIFQNQSFLLTIQCYNRKKPRPDMQRSE